MNQTTHVITTTGYGSMIFWDSSTVGRESLQSGFRDLGITKFLPQGRTELGTLQDCLRMLYPEKKGYLIRPLANAGYELLTENKGEEKNTREFITSFLLGPDKSVVMTNRDSEKLEAVNNAYRSLLEYYTPNDITRCLKNLIMSIPHGLGGTSLRKAGGIYWLQEESMEMFRKVSSLLESLSPMKLYHVHHKLGEKEKQAVLKGIVDELVTRIDSIKGDVYRGDLQNSGLENRLDLLEHIEKKAELYESILNTTLDSTRALIQKTKSTITTAILMLDTQQPESQSLEGVTA